MRFGSIDFCYHSSKSGMLLTVDVGIPKCPSCFPRLIFQPQVCVCCYVYQPFKEADDILLHPVATLVATTDRLMIFDLDA